MDDINDHIFGGDLPVDPEDFAKGGRVGYSDGTKPSAAENTPSQEIINRMIAQIKQLSKRGVDVNTIKDIVGASDQMIKDVLGQANGGSMSKGLDYLMGIERRGYAEGTDPTTEALKLLLLQNSGDGGDSTQATTNTTSTPSSFQPTVMDVIGLLTNPVMGIANMASRSKTGLSLVEQAMDAMGIGRGPGGRTQGYGVDSANAQSVSDEGTVDANEGFGSQSGNDGPSGPGGAAGGGSDGADANDGFAQGGRVKYLKGGLSYLMGL